MARVLFQHAPLPQHLDRQILAAARWTAGTKVSNYKLQPFEAHDAVTMTNWCRNQSHPAALADCRKDLDVQREASLMLNCMRP
jgi:hypothetical protein